MLRLTEIFYSIQGEAAAAGRPCVFVRLSRCNLRCTWCDTTYSFKGGEKFSIDEVLAQARTYGCPLVEITGGEPLLQPDVHELMRRLLAEGFEVMLETSGSLDIGPVPAGVHVIMDLKPPGSGEVEKNRYENVPLLKLTDELKFVILDRADYDWALAQCDVLAPACEVVFSPVHGELSANTLAQWMLADKVAARLSLQMHKFMGVE